LKKHFFKESPMSQKPLAEKILAYLDKYPKMRAKDVAEHFNVHPSYIYAMRKRAARWQPPALIPMPIVDPVIPTEEDKPAAKKLYVPMAAAMLAKKLGIPLETYVKEMRKADPTAFEETNDLTPDEGANVDAVLDSRAKDYGRFKDGAALMQGMKRLMSDHARVHDKTFADDQWEALEMIVHKIARIINGNPDKVDHWVDIAGYATLVAERLEGNAR
jgi:uncharacterized protein YbjQ (UPF0145 family)